MSNAAASTGCDILNAEDMPHRQAFDSRMSIINLPLDQWHLTVRATGHSEFMDIQQNPANNTRAIILLCLMIIGWLAIIYLESSQPPPKILGEIPGLDKIAHFVVYSILGAMIWRILAIIAARKRILIFSLTLFLVLLAGIFDEIHQSYVPNRNVDGWDLLADFCGGVIATVLIFLTSRTKNRLSYN